MLSLSSLSWLLFILLYRTAAGELRASRGNQLRPILPAKMVPARIPWLKLSGKFPLDMGVRIPPLGINILLESNPLKSRILVRSLAVREVSSPHPHCDGPGLTHFLGPLRRTGSRTSPDEAPGVVHWLPDRVGTNTFFLQEGHKSPTLNVIHLP